MYRAMRQEEANRRFDQVQRTSAIQNKNPASNFEFDCIGCAENLLCTCAPSGSSTKIWYPTQSFFMLSSNQPSAAVAVRGIELEPEP